MWFNPIMKWMVYSPLHGMVSGNTMVVVYSGCRTGKTYTLPVGYIKSGGELLTTSFKDRTWWRNLRGGVRVIVHLQGKDRHARAVVVEDLPGVMEGLKEFIQQSDFAARMLRIPMDANGELDPESLRQAAETRVIIRTRLE